jgi:hypothetical protein
VGKRVTIKVSPKKLKAFKHRIKDLTGRSRGVSMEQKAAASHPSGTVGARLPGNVDGIEQFRQIVAKTSKTI